MPYADTPEGRAKHKAQWTRANAERVEYRRAYYVANGDRIRANSAARKAANYDAAVARDRAYRQSDKGRETKRRASEAERQRDPAQIAARSALNVAVRTGKVKREPCEICGSTTQVHAHHPFGYAPEMALAVWWLCQPHHTGIHAAMGD